MAKNIFLFVVFIASVGCASMSREEQAASAPMPAGAERMDKGCNTPLGYLADGASAFGYLQPIAQSGQSCQQGTITCTNGTWEGPFIHPSCTRMPKQ